MFNNRKIEDRRVQRALDECRSVLDRYDLPGAVMIVGQAEAAFTYRMHARWSAIMADATVPSGFRIRASVARDGVDGRHRLLEAAAHTIMSLRDFGLQTVKWMEDLHQGLAETGLRIDHTSFGGKPLPDVILQRHPKPPP